MPLDNRLLLYCLVTVSAAMTLSIVVALQPNEQGGLKKWACAMGLESAAWLLFAIHNSIPLAVSVILANAIFSTAQAIKLVAVYEYQKFKCPVWQCVFPVVANLLTFGFLLHGSQDELIAAGSLIYAMQMLLLGVALLGDTRSRGNAWKLLFVSTSATVAVYLLRVIDVLADYRFSAWLQLMLPQQTLQNVTMLGVIGLSVTESMGFVLMLKQRSDRENLSLAMTDALTGTFNRRAFMERADKECFIAQRHGLPLALLMIDVDHFKKINDRYGHPAGDEVLAEIARLLTSRLRKEDTLGRYGGEEFCVLLPGTDEPGAVAIGEALRMAISTSPLTKGSPPVFATVSIGITVKPAADRMFRPDFSKLLAAADAALYQAKHDGRNRVVLLNSLRTPVN